MAETLLFSIPTPTNTEDAPESLRWYQSDDGINWDLTFTDSILIENLVIDTETGLYQWDSLLTSSTRWHKITTVSIYNNESSQGYIFPPRPAQETTNLYSQITTNKLETGKTFYDIGDVVDLMLEIDNNAISKIGDTITIHILDPFDNIISNVIAQRIDDNLYVAEYTVTNSLKQLYNIYNEQEQDINYYTLRDRWLLSDGSVLEFQFYVNRLSTEITTKENNIIHISLSGIEDINSNIIEDTIIEFTTALTPYYGNIDSVKKYAISELSNISNFDIARDIIEWSNYVDLHMRPDIIYYTPQYENAVREYINASIAKYLLVPILNTNLESKELDTFKITRQSGGGEYVIKKLDDLIDKYEKVIFAGGRDTSMLPTLFTKGLNDPNRPNVARATLMINDSYPWVNTTTSSSTINLDGQDVEIRGVRGITFRSIFRLPPTSITRLNEISF